MSSAAGQFGLHTTSSPTSAVFSQKDSVVTARIVVTGAIVRIAMAWAVPLFVLFLWALTGALGKLPELTLPPPGAVLSSLQDLAQTGDLAASLLISLRRLASGFVVGAVLGLSVGAATGLSKLVASMLRPTLMAFVQVPVLAWIPLLMIPLGIGESLKVIAISMAAFTPMALNAGAGFRHVSPQLVEVGTLYRLTPAQRLQHILLPGAMPAILTGFRLGLTQAWQSLVVVELVASTDGIGYLTVEARQLFRLDQMLATMAVIGIVGFVLDRSLREIQTRLGRRFGDASV